jgi:hypothetical protein
MQDGRHDVPGPRKRGEFVRDDRCVGQRAAGCVVLQVPPQNCHLKQVHDSFLNSECRYIYTGIVTRASIPVKNNFDIGPDRLRTAIGGNDAR